LKNDSAYSNRIVL
jgi:hypothetical protein